MKLSMRAAWANMVPFLVYGIIMFVLFFIAAMPLMLGFLIMLPLAFITYYTTYKDVFDVT
ncbi:MAG: hypothetical protein ABIT70_03845, partial [Sulfuriferula sp.]